MATTTPARTSSTKKRSPKRGESPDIELLERNDDGTFRARLFGEEEFTISDDVNAYLLLNAGRDRTGAGFLDLMDSLVVVEPPEDGDLDRATENEKDRFHSLLARQRQLSVERLASLINDITEIAGNENDDSSSTD